MRSAQKLLRKMGIFRTASLPFLALCVIGLTLPLSRAASEVSAIAELSQPEVNAGEVTELQVRVTGAEVADVPRELAVDGLQIRLTGQSTQVQMINFKVTSSVVYSYVVMPLRVGKFTIPAIPVRTTSGLLRTSPLDFSVTDGNGSNANPQPQNQMPQPGMPGFSPPSAPPPTPSENLDRVAYGELTCPKKTIYAGEMVPVEIRYYFDAHFPVRAGRVDFESEGIIVERFPDPKESRIERNGNTYNVLTYRTLLSAVKPGSIDIPPAKLESQIQMPGALPPGFDNPFFQQALGGRNPFTESRDVTVKTAPLHLEVLPLPKEGRPSSFAGAIGQFDIDGIIANPKPAPGDPADLTIKIGGKGNFNAMGVPVLTETEGWRTYPPSDKFEGTDDLSLSGVKTFDFTLIAQEQKTNSPRADFSYFDPVDAKYVTLTVNPLPLEASPGGSPASSLAATGSPTPAPTQATPQVVKSTAAPKEGDPLSSVTLHSWQTPVSRPEFLVANVAMLVAAGALVGILRFYSIQKEGGTLSSRRRRRSTELWTALNSDTLDAAGMYDAALEYVALIPEQSEACAAAVESLAARRDVLKYGSGRSVALSREEQKNLIDTLANLSSATSR